MPDRGKADIDVRILENIRRTGFQEDSRNNRNTMERKNFTEVVIDSRIYRLGGYESEEYLHQVASYLNNKISEMKTLDGYGHLSTSSKSLMLNLNTADDYFKAKKQADRLEEDLSDKDRELYEVKHELVSLQVKAEETAREITALNARIAELEEELARSEAEKKENSKEESSENSDDIIDLDSNIDMEMKEIDGEAEEDTLESFDGSGPLELPDLPGLPEFSELSDDQASFGSVPSSRSLNFNKRRKTSQRGWKR
jgi:cell division protein ZapA